MLVRRVVVFDGTGGRGFFGCDFGRRTVVGCFGGGLGRLLDA
jgi:hypothetical protein